jgi:hypothetical protein
MDAHLLREQRSDAGDTDIPGNMPLHLTGGHAEIAERARHQPAVMIAGEEERRPAACIFLNHRRNFVGVQESSRES